MDDSANAESSVRLVAVVLIAAALLRLCLVVLVPADEKDREAFFVGYNDEPAHHNYVKHLVEQRRLPVNTARITDPDAFERYAFEYYQAPLYYVLAVPFHAVGETLCEGCGLYGVRLFSVMLSLLTLGLLYRFVDRYGGVEHAALGITLFFALLLGHARFSAQVNNDNLLWPLALLGFYLLFADLRAGGGDTRTWSVLGLLAGLGLVTKSSFLTILAGPPLALLVLRRDARAARCLALFAGLALAIAAPWWIRNRIVYGEWLAMSVAVGEPRTELDLDYLRELFALHLVRLPLHFWSGFENTFAREHQQAALKLPILASLGIMGAAAWYWVRRMLDPVGRREEGALLCGVLVSSLGNLAGFVWYTFRYGQGEVRMLFPSLAGFAYLGLVPLYRMVPQPHRSKVTWGLAALTLVPWIGFL